MGYIIDNIVSMTNEDFLLLHNKIKEFVEIYYNGTIKEKRKIYHDKKKYNEYMELSDIFEELGSVFSGEIDLIHDIVENESDYYEDEKREEDNLNKIIILNE